MSTTIEDKNTSIEELIDRLIEECCEQDSPSLPLGGDCCYDDWKKKHRDVTVLYEKISEEARLAQEELNVVTNRRDREKKWLDELDSSDEMADNACSQLDQLANHLVYIHESTEMSVDAITILFCMINDFYTQIDEIKVKYDYIINCIKCLDHPVFETGDGLLKCLEEYYLALEELIKTRDSIIVLIMEAMNLIKQLSVNLGREHGLGIILGNLKELLNCENDQDEENSGSKKKQGKKSQSSDPDDEICAIVPRLSLPIAKGEYYEDVDKFYKEDKELVKDLAQKFASKNKKKGKLLTCKTSLENALKEVDPKNRCK